MQTSIPAVVIRRVFAAPPQALYDAWTTPDMLRQFLPPGSDAVIDTLDVRAGGRYRFGMRSPDGDMWYVKGEYRDVRPPHRLSMTWCWEEDNPADERETLLTLEFNAAEGGGTELLLTHDAFTSETSRNNHNEGWTQTLDNLERALAR